MGKQIRVPLQFERRTEIESGPAAQGAQKRLQADQQHEADAQRYQKVAVHGGEDFIHRELQEQRADDGEKLQGRGQDKDLSQGALESHYAANEVAQAERVALVTGSEAGSGSKFQRDAGEIA